MSVFIVKICLGVVCAVWKSQVDTKELIYKLYFCNCGLQC